MYDANKVIPGLIIFLGLMSMPIWYGLANEKAAYVPKPEVIADEKQCIEPMQYMRDKHIEMLQDWKESVVREGVRTYVASDSKEYNISLVRTCMECHSNKAEFCDQCHNYVGTKPKCWDCHKSPEDDQ